MSLLFVSGYPVAVQYPASIAVKANSSSIAYLYPNDEIELDRLDMQYEIIRMVNGGRIFFAPLDNPERLLDIGTGSGIWPIEMGKSSTFAFV